MHASEELAPPPILGQASKVAQCGPPGATLCQWPWECGGLAKIILYLHSGAFANFAWDPPFTPCVARPPPSFVCRDLGVLDHGASLIVCFLFFFLYDPFHGWTYQTLYALYMMNLYIAAR